MGAGLVGSEVAVVIVRDYHARGEVGEDGAPGAFKNGTIGNIFHIEIILRRVRFQSALIPDDGDGPSPAVGRMSENRLQFHRTNIWIVFIADALIDFDGGGSAAVDGIP